MITLERRSKPLPRLLDRARVDWRSRGLWRGCILAMPFWRSGRIQDVSGRQGHGIIDSSASLTWKGSIWGSCLNWAGTAALAVTVPDPPANWFDGLSELSVEVLFRSTDLSSERGLVVKYRPSTGERAWQLGTDTTNIRFQVSSDGTGFEQKQSSGLTLATGTWYQLIVTYKAGTFAVWVDGKARATTGNFTTHTSIFAGGQPVKIGVKTSSSGSPVDGFKGDIASVRVWNRALRAAEVQLLWERPWGMYSIPFPFHSFALLHSGSATAGPWILAGTAPKGQLTFDINDLQNGVSYDVQAKTVDTSMNVSSGSSIVAETPAVGPTVWPFARRPRVLTAVQHPFLNR